MSNFVLGISFSIIGDVVRSRLWLIALHLNSSLQPLLLKGFGALIILCAFEQIIDDEGVNSSQQVQDTE